MEAEVCILVRLAVKIVVNESGNIRDVDNALNKEIPISKSLPNLGSV